MSHAARPDRLASLVAALRGAGFDPTWKDLSDALWLAQYTRGGAEEAPGDPGDGWSARHGHEPARERARTEAEERTTENERPSEAGEEERPAGPGRPPRADDETVSLYADPGEPARRDAARPRGEALPVGVPEARALPGLLAMERALRPLRRYTPPTGPPRRPHRGLVLDEPETAQRTARAGGLLTPVFRAEPRGHTELQLLMDAAPAMRVWQRMLGELAEVFGRLGAFRDIQVHYLHRSPDGSPAVSRRFDPEGAALRPARQLGDPTGRRLTVVVSDCAGPLWREGTAHRLLYGLARHAPVAVVQPLPQRLWPRTRLPASSGTLLREPGPAGSVRLRFLAEGLSAARPVPARAVPVPLLPPTAAALGAWAGLLAGTGPGRVPAAVGWARADQPAAGRPRAPGGGRSAAEALARFRASASPGAVRLAVYLAAAPLFLPVMQLIQRTMLPDSGPSELSEVLLGGLVRRLDEPPPGSPSDGLWFTFVDGVHEALLTELGHDEALLVLKHCSGYVARRFGDAGPNFPALALAQLSGAESGEARALAEAAGADEEGAALPRPFAEVAAKVLRRFLPVAPLPPREEGRERETPSRVVGRARELTAAYEEDGQVRHLLAAVGLLRHAVTERPDPELWADLAEGLLRLWRVQRDGELLAEAERAARTAAAHAGSHRGRTVLARVLHAAAGRRRAAGDTRGALELWRLADREFAAVQATPGLDREAALGVTLDRVEVLTAQWRLGGDSALLQESVGIVEAVADAWPADEPQPSGLWLAHGRALLLLADAARGGERVGVHAGQAADSLRQGCRALESERAPARVRVRALLDLVDALLRTDQEWREADGVIQAAERLADDPATRSACLTRAGRLAIRAFERDGQVAELEAAAARFEKAGRLVSRDRPEYSALIEEWGAALLRRADREDGAPFVSRAVRVLRDCRMETAADDPRLPARLLLLGRALTTRYRDAVDMVDLREAEHLFQRAARGAGEPLTRARALLELGDTHRRVFRHTRGFERLDLAAEAYRAAASAARAAEADAVDPAEPVRLAATALHQRGAVFETARRPLAAGDAYRAALQQWRRLPDEEKSGAETVARLEALLRER